MSRAKRYTFRRKGSSDLRLDTRDGVQGSEFLTKLFKPTHNDSFSHYISASGGDSSHPLDQAERLERSTRRYIVAVCVLLIAWGILYFI